MKKNPSPEHTNWFESPVPTILQVRTWTGHFEQIYIVSQANILSSAEMILHISFKV
jgi:hypothetical protein